MTPRQFEPRVVELRLTEMGRLLRLLEQVGEVSVERLEAEPLLRAAVERLLSQLVELAVAINGHAASTLLGRGPAGYAESFADAAAAGLVPRELAEELQPSAGMRNVLVHEYLKIDLAVVAEAIPRARSGFDRYVAAVARFLLRPADSQT